MYAFSVLASLLAVVSASPAPVPDGTATIPIPTIGPCTDSIKPHAHIIATPSTTVVGGLQLTYDSASGRATLTDNGFYSLWDFSNGGVAQQPDCAKTKLWLNINPVATEYRPLYWNKTQITTNWSAAYGYDLVAKETKQYNTTDTFIACLPLNPVVKKVPWYLFLLTPTSVPLASAPSLKGFDTNSCVKTRLTVEIPYP
ncbi:hypothetical protein M407DRAFT_5041 [Tulasnella calospora MUT 4182]|uniref:Ubiquitin 3 binding protein But2 C-terminal domain-containing protein n=1 Tax=Tulasnella calospora MUT 4182 TaxID=1051891 RepID=A0A0C3QHP7_9AGAM|nr:hypothetical protein M407DRAFT_5041 [Tulasnella calospora MUT 4182]